MNDKFLTQTVLSQDYSSLIMCQQFNNSIGTICSFMKKGKTYTTDFNTPINRIHRVKKIFSMIPQVCDMKTTKTDVSLDCVKLIDENTDIFPSNTFIKSGIFHFDVISCDSIDDQGKEIQLCDINPRLLLKKIDNGYNKTINLDIPKYDVNKIKVFSIVMFKGFMLCVINKRRSILNVVVNNSQSGLIGKCMVNNKYMLNYIKTVWPFINYKITGKIINIYIDDNIIDKDSAYPELIKFERLLNNNEVEINQLGKSLFIK